MLGRAQGVAADYWRLTRRGAACASAGLLCGAAAACLAACAAEMTGRVMRGDEGALTGMLWASMGAAVLTSARGALFTYSQRQVGEEVAARVYDCLLRQPPSFYEATPVADMARLAGDDARVVSEQISLNVNVLSRNAVGTAVTLYMMRGLPAGLTLAALLAAAAGFAASCALDGAQGALARSVDSAARELSDYVFDTVSRASVVASHATEDECVARRGRLAAAKSRLHALESAAYGVAAMVNFGAPVLGSAALMWLAARAGGGRGGPGLPAYFLHCRGLLQSAREASEARASLARSREPYRRVTCLLSGPRRADGGLVPAGGALRASVEFRGVSHRSQGSCRDTLRSFDMAVREGARVGIVGGSGEGKSTLARILVGLSSPSAGAVLVGGVDALRYDRRWLMRRVGYVPQDPALFGDTLHNNIACGAEGATREMVQRAARLAGAHGFIEALPEGYDTVFGRSEAGTLSGGQRQRICIARALARRPALLVLDEATSALDRDAEAEVLAGLAEYLDGDPCVTAVVIAHKESALSIVDTVYRLSGGRLERLDGWPRR